MAVDQKVIDSLRWWQNTVTPHKASTLIGTEVGTIDIGIVPGSPTTGVLRASLHKGRASQGYKSDYDRVETWWVTIQITPTGHPRYFERGTRFSGKNAEKRARKEYAESVALLREVAAA